MTFGKLENGLHVADFMCYDFAEIEPFIGHCKVQAMHDGNVYISELPRRIRNKALFRDDNCSLTLGRDGKYYFVFTYDAQKVAELPRELVRQAGAIGQKVISRIIFKKED